jgi:hypothetical protein
LLSELLRRIHAAEAQEEMRSVREELQKTQAAETGMNQIKLILNPLQDDMTNISDRLGAFASVWAVVSVPLPLINAGY